MGKIIKLNEKLSNMIAAGEVVERCSSVVKELVENSLDAKSSYIEVELKESGLTEIKVTDNGEGMSENDALLAFSRHATSKIKNEHDLFRISSLGFRGEAIPSIASVSKFHLKTSTGEDTGYEVVVNGGKLIKKGITSARKGTEITINNLFYNTPARLKYLKSPHSELSYIVETINKMALANPKIAFLLKNNGKVILNTSGRGDITHVLANIYGKDIVKKMDYVENKSRNFKISGYITIPSINRSSRNYISIIANSRTIKNNKVKNAVIEGYDTYIPKGRFPIALINVEVDPLLIDVNIHPQKLEVKFSEEKELVDLINATVKNKLLSKQLIPVIENKEKIEDNIQQEKLSFDLTNKSNDNLFVSENKQSFIVKNNVTNENLNTEIKRVRKIPVLEYIGQLYGTYLLCQNEEGFYVIDQHAAAERVNYEKFLSEMVNPTKLSYDILIPINFNLSNHEYIIILDKLEDIKQFGIVLEPSGINSFYIRSVPHWFIKGYEFEYTEEVVRALINNQDISVNRVRDDLAKSLSCKQSIKANKFINEGEIRVLLEKLEYCENPYTCPHGRPTIIKFTQYEIEKWFKRVK